MTRLNRHVRVRIGKQNAATLGSTGTDFSFSTTGTDTRLGRIESWGGQKVYPIEGRTESETWSVRLVETSTGEEITSRLATTDGRPDLLRRLIDTSVRPTTEGSWSSTHVQATGRLKDVLLTEDIGAWDFVALDERLIERETEAFVGVSTTAGPTSTTGVDTLHGTTTTQVYPMGRTIDWGGAASVGRGTILYNVEAATSDLVALEFDPDEVPSARRPWVTREVAEAIKDDIDPAADPINEGQALREGTHRTLVAQVGGVNRPITSIIENGEVGSPATGSAAPQGARVIDEVTVRWTSGQPSTGSQVAVMLYAPQRAPDDTIPTHLGGTGQHPVGIARDMLTDAGVRIDSTQFDALEADKRYPQVTYRVTDSDRLDNWLETHIWQPFGLVPTVNRHGEVSPRVSTLPSATGADAVPDVTALTQFTSTSVREDPPTWEHISNEQVTRIEYQFETYRDYTFSLPAISGSEQPDIPDGLAADALDAKEPDTDPIEHDKITEFGTRTERVTLDGLHDAEAAQAAADSFAQETFARFGDGPVRTNVRGLTGLEGVEVGDYVIINNVPVYPNLKSGERGGSRLLQVLNKRFTPAGPEFELLDAGSTSQPLSAPTISVAQSSSRPRHQIDVTVTGLSGEARALIERNPTGTAPVSTDPGWQKALTTDSTNAVADGGLPSGTTFYYRARQIRAGRIGSLWSTLDSTATAQLPAPTSLSASSVTGCKVVAKWTPGSTDYPTRVGLSGEPNIASVSPGVGYYRIHDGNSTTISADSTHTLEVKHFDGFGGVGAAATTDFVTGAAEKMDPLIGGGILVGEETLSASSST